MARLDGLVLSCIYDAQAQQVEVGAAVHRSFDQLEAMHMSFDGSIAPRVLKGGDNSPFVATEVFGKVGQQTG